MLNAWRHVRIINFRIIIIIIIIFWQPQTALTNCEQTTTPKIFFILLSLTYKVLTTAQPPYLHNDISIQPPCSTCSSSVIILACPPTSSSKCITDLSFWYASHCLWNQHPTLSTQQSPSITPSLSLPHLNLPLFFITHFFGSVLQITLATHHLLDASKYSLSYHIITHLVWPHQPENPPGSLGLSP